MQIIYVHKKIPNREMSYNSCILHIRRYIYDTYPSDYWVIQKCYLKLDGLKCYSEWKNLYWYWWWHCKRLVMEYKKHLGRMKYRKHEKFLVLSKKSRNTPCKFWGKFESFMLIMHWITSVICLRSSHLLKFIAKFGGLPVNSQFNFFSSIHSSHEGKA